MSVVRSSEVVRFSEVLNTLVLYGKFNRCFDGYPFYRGHPLLGGSAKRRFTVICYRPCVGCWYCTDSDTQTRAKISFLELCW